MNWYRAKYTVLVQVPISAAAQANKTFNFEQQQQLQTIFGDQRVVVEAIETYTVAAIAKSPVNTNLPVATAADLANATLTLQFGTFQGVWQMPLVSLNRVLPDQSNYAPGVIDLMLFREMVRVDWTKSFVQLVDTAPTATPFAYLFNVYYDYLPV